MRVGAVFEARARDLTSEGQAVVSAPNGQTVFVTGLWLNELAKVKITALKGRVGFAELVELLEASAERRAAPCKYHGASRSSCGGCPWMFVEYSSQLKAKQNRVENALQRVIKKFKVSAIQASPNELSYRNRVQVKSDGERLGFVASKTNTIVDVDDCLILSEPNRFNLKKLRSQLPEKLWATTRKWTTLNLDEDTPAKDVSVNKRLPFKQANALQNSFMKNWLSSKLAKINAEGIALELFCGSGNFTEVLSNHGFDKIVSIEGQPSAIEALQIKQLRNVDAHCADLFDEENLKKIIKNNRDASLLLLDPPRDGLKSRNALFDSKTKIRDVFYISCDLATFIRDLKLFIDNGFQLKELQPVDQFPQTPHVELLCHLTR